MVARSGWAPRGGVRPDPTRQELGVGVGERWAAARYAGLVGLPFVVLAGSSFLPHHGYRVVLIVGLWFLGSALSQRVVGPPRRGARASPLWWLRHDGIGRSRLGLLAVVVAGAVGWAVLDWPEWGFPVGAVGLAVVLVAGDYCFYWYGVRKARRA